MRIWEAIWDTRLVGFQQLASRASLCAVWGYHFAKPQNRRHNNARAFSVPSYNIPVFSRVSLFFVWPHRPKPHCKRMSLPGPLLHLRPPGPWQRRGSGRGRRVARFFEDAIFRLLRQTERNLQASFSPPILTARLCCCQKRARDDALVKQWNACGTFTTCAINEALFQTPSASTFHVHHGGRN